MKALLMALIGSVCSLPGSGCIPADWLSGALSAGLGHGSPNIPHATLLGDAP